MKASHVSCSLSILSVVLVHLAEPLEPFTVCLVAGGISALGGTIGGIYNYFTQERCNQQWISFDLRSLQVEMENSLFGQHIASPLILTAVNGFMTNPDPGKPLVLSLHGPTGTGKNLVSKMIANSIYRRGMQSEFVHLIVASKDFPHENQVDRYKVQLQAFIEEKVANCENSMFIFDEMDQMHPGLIDIIKPYLDHHSQLGRVSYRRNIFIFLSMAGGPEILEITQNSIIAGKSRTDIKLRDLEEEVSLAVISQKGGLFQSDLVNRNLIDFFVPFLPLQRHHVIRCILSEMRKRNLRPDINVANELADDLTTDSALKIPFITSGCKTIEARLPFYV